MFSLTTCIWQCTDCVVRVSLWSPCCRTVQASDQQRKIYFTYLIVWCHRDATRLITRYFYHQSYFLVWHCVCFHNEVVFCPHLKVLFINPYVAIGSIYPVPNWVYLPPDLSLFWCCLTIGTSGRSFVTFLVCDLATKWHRGTVSSDPLKTTATSRSDSRGDRRWSQRHLRNYRGMQPVSRRLTTLASTLSQTRSSQRWNPSFLQRATVAATVSATSVIVANIHQSEIRIRLDDLSK